MNVWIATWEVRNSGSGLEVFASKVLAVDAATGYADEMSLLGPESLTEEAARAELVETGSIEFESEECYYSIEEHEVNGLES